MLLIRTNARRNNRDLVRTNASEARRYLSGVVKKQVTLAVRRFSTRLTLYVNRFLRSQYVFLLSTFLRRLRIHVLYLLIKRNFRVIAHFSSSLSRLLNCQRGFLSIVCRAIMHRSFLNILRRQL